MFKFLRDINNLSERINMLKDDLYDYKKTMSSAKDKLREELEAKIKGEVDKIEQLSIEDIKHLIDKRLVDFHKEITDKYFNSLEAFMKHTKEIELIQSLSAQVKNEDMARLRTSLMQPIIDNNRKEEIKKIDDNIKSMGEQILAKRKELNELYLVLDREKKDTKDIKIKLEILDWVIGVNK